VIKNGLGIPKYPIKKKGVDRWILPYIFRALVRKAAYTSAAF
jgi:hypothetical protein